MGSSKGRAAKAALALALAMGVGAHAGAAKVQEVGRLVAGGSRLEEPLAGGGCVAVSEIPVMDESGKTVQCRYSGFGAGYLVEACQAGGKCWRGAMEAKDEQLDAQGPKEGAGARFEARRGVGRAEGGAPCLGVLVGVWSLEGFQSFESADGAERVQFPVGSFESVCVSDGAASKPGGAKAAVATRAGQSWVVEVERISAPGPLSGYLARPGEAPALAGQAWSVWACERGGKCWQGGLAQGEFGARGSLAEDGRAFAIERADGGSCSGLWLGEAFSAGGVEGAGEPKAGFSGVCQELGDGSDGSLRRARVAPSKDGAVYDVWLQPRASRAAGLD